MAERKDLYGDMAPRRTLRKAHAVKRSRALRKELLELLLLQLWQ